MRQSVVLPAPLGPTSPILSRSAMRHDRSRKRTCPPNDLAIDSTAISGSSHALDGVGLDLGDHAHLAGPAVRILVLAHVFLGQRVDVLIGALLGHLHDAPAHLHVAIRVVRVLHGERDHRVRLEVLVLHAAAGRVDANVRAVEVAPHRRHLGLAVAADGGEVAESLLVDLAERAIDLHRRLQHQAVEPLLLRVALVDMHESPPVMAPSSAWVGAPRWPPHPPTLGSAPGNPGRSSIMLMPSSAWVGAPRWPPHPPTLGSAPGNPGRSSIILMPSSAWVGAPRWPPHPPTLGSAPGNPGRSSIILMPSSAQHRARRPSPAARRATARHTAGRAAHPA